MPASRRIGAPRPGPAIEPPLLVESREQLVYLITQACELEQGVLCEYLFALYSLKRDPQDGLASQQHAQVTRWGRTLSKVAIQEMQHLALATNLLTALGAVPHLHRPNFPIRCQWYPPDVRLALVPFGEAALRHFMYLERPDSVDLDDAEAFRAICECRPLTATPATLMAAPQDYHTVGHLYRSIEHGFARLVDRYGEAGGFIGPPRAQASREGVGWPELVAGTDPATPRAPLRPVVRPGQGPGGHRPGGGPSPPLPPLPRWFPGGARARPVLPAGAAGPPRLRPAPPGPAPGDHHQRPAHRAGGGPVRRRPPDDAAGAVPLLPPRRRDQRGGADPGGDRCAADGGGAAAAGGGADHLAAWSRPPLRAGRPGALHGC